MQERHQIEVRAGVLEVWNSDLKKMKLKKNIYVNILMFGRKMDMDIIDMDMLNNQNFV